MKKFLSVVYPAYPAYPQENPPFTSHEVQFLRLDDLMPRKPPMHELYQQDDPKGMGGDWGGNQTLFCHFATVSYGFRFSMTFS